MRARVNATSSPPSDLTLHGAFFQLAAEQPWLAALAWGIEGRMSYGDLAAKALCVGGMLRSRGVEPGDLVGLSLPSGPDQVAAVLGILAAGGTYVPVGVDQPKAHRDRIYLKAGVRFVLDDSEEGTGDPLDAPIPVSPDSLAYVIHTSGTTGEPRGVEVTHRSAVNTVKDVNARFGVGESDRVLAVSALDFDLSVYDLFGLLSAGGTVVLVEEGAQREARRWVDLVRRWDVTVWNSVPALLEIFLVAAEADRQPLGLRLALVSGDWIGLDLPGRLSAITVGCRFIGLGGATEAAIWSNAIEVVEVPEHWRSIPYGYPLHNQEYRVVDARGRDRPDWVPGELWIGGAGVARGFLGDTAATALSVRGTRG